MASNPFNNNQFSMGYGDLGSSKAHNAPPAPEGAWKGADDSEEVNLGGTEQEFDSSVPAASSANGGSMSAKDIKKREKELAKREKQLAQREEDLRKKEEQLAQSGTAVAQQVKNWPRCYPLIHHDIEGDIPADFQRTVKVAWIMLWVFAAASLVNWIGSLVALIVIGGGDGRLPGFFLALIYLVGGVPLAFALWYRALYKSAIRDRAFGFAWFFLTFLAFMVFIIWSLVAPDILVSQWSHTGVLSSITAFDKKTIVGIFYIIGTVMWGITTLLGIVVLKMVYMRFRGRGRDAPTLKQEMVQTLSTRV